ncbi:MAG TPA: hypothetical protein VGN57_12720 [Pirellulaceae bacterium]|nr:hypothetical protein [Pirellulaceae bacterium]
MSGETIPPYAVMRVTGGGYDEFGNYLHNVAKPDAEERKAYLVNGRESVESGKRGGGHWLFGVDGQVLATGSADIDAVMGPSEGSWALQQEKLGFVVVGDTKTTSEDGMTVRAIQQFRVPDEDECDYIPKKWSDISGYVAGEIQMLVKLADSCPEWVTVGPCEEEESG